MEKLILMNDGLSGESCVLLSSIYKEIAPAPLKQLHFDNNVFLLFMNSRFLDEWR